LPTPQGSSLFNRDPEIKAVAVWAGDALRRNNMFASQNGPSVQVLDDKGKRATILTDLPPFDSLMTHAADPRGVPELLMLRERMRGWSFYDNLRTDPMAPARRTQVETRTIVLASDGADIAAALQTINEIGNSTTLNEAIEDGFPSSSMEVSEMDGSFDVTTRQKGLLRPLRISELSDGTLRYLLLVAALLTPRPPSLLLLNEPETSLHQNLLPSLARLISLASHRSQVIVVSHAAPLVTALSDEEDTSVFPLGKELGETVIPGISPPPWGWPKRWRDRKDTGMV